MGKWLSFLMLSVMTALMLLFGQVYAQSLTHVADYKISGTIWLQKQAGHFCNTGAEVKHTIVGTGDLEKEMNIEMVKGLIEFQDDNEFTTAENALKNLVITSSIKLCSPPKHTYDDIPVAINSYYRDEDQPPASWRNYSDTEEWQAVSSQIWAVRVEAYPGYDGRLVQDMEAAYGSYTGGSLTEDDDRWRLSSDGESTRRGPRYVGDYFNIRQRASTKMGEVKRHIDISSPWSHGYLYEDTSVIGISSVRERFRMTNIRVGSDIDKKWYELF